MNSRLIGFLIGLLAPALALGAGLSESDRATLGTPKNLIFNSGAENGTAGWAKSAGTFTTGISSSYDGTRYFSWTPNAAADTVTGGAIAVPSGLQGKQGVISCMVNTSGVLHKLQVTDGTNVLNSNTTLDVVQGNGTWQTVTKNIVFPTSGSVYPRILAGDTANVKWDACILGDATRYNLTQASQAQWVGDMVITGCTGNFNWSGTTFADPGSLPTGCTYTATGALTAPSTMVPGFKVTGGAGKYLVVFGGLIGNAATTGQANFRLTDGTNNSNEEPSYQASTGTNEPLIGNGIWSLTESSAITGATFKIQAKGDTGSANPHINAAALKAVFSVYRYPSQTDQLYRMESGPGSSWGGYTSGAAYNTTSTTYVDPTLSSGTPVLNQKQNINFGSVTQAASNVLGITFIPPKLGRFYVCGTLTEFGAAGAGKQAYARLYDGTNVIGTGAIVTPLSATSASYGTVPVCGVANFTSLSSTTLKLQFAAESGATANLLNNASTLLNPVEWSIFQLDSGQAAPVISQGLVTSNSTSNIRIEAGRITWGASPTITSTGGASVSGAAATKTVTWATPFTSSVFCSLGSSLVTTDFYATLSGAPTSSSFSLVGVQRSSGAGVTATSADFTDFVCVGPR